jgi:tetratricopeptide (TPR) repeat protein
MMLNSLRPRLRAAKFVLCFLASLTATACAPLRSDRQDSAVSPESMWSQWGRLAPILLIASQRVQDPHSRTLLKNLEKDIDRGDWRRAQLELIKKRDGVDRHWMTVIRANLAALHYVDCFAGLTLRLPTAQTMVQARAIHREAPEKAEPGDISIEELLVALDEATLDQDFALQTQSRIARARMSAIVALCPANQLVAKRAQEQLAADLSMLAAAGHLAPDLAYLWAIDRLNQGLPNAASPHLLAAREGGYLDPHVDLLLAQIDLELGFLDSAREAIMRAEKHEPSEVGEAWLAEVLSLRGDIEWARNDLTAAKLAYERAEKLAPANPAAALGKARIAIHKQKLDIAVGEIRRAMENQASAESLTGDRQARERLTIFFDQLLLTIEREPALAEAIEEALVTDIHSDASPVRRAYRYLALATLNVRTGDLELARGRAVLARDAWLESGLPDEIESEAFMRHLDALEADR